jgi:hypothetical protein
MGLGVKIDELTANIGRVHEEIRQQQDDEEGETKHRNPKELWQRRQELEEGQAKAKQWWKE